VIRVIIAVLTLIAVPLIAGTEVSFNGTSYTVPGVGESDWAGDNKVDGLLKDLANNGFAKTGGTFTLSAEVDYGATAGLLGLYFGSTTANVATTGAFRLANTECVGWRNGANDASNELCVDSSNSLTYNGNILIDPSGLLPATAGGTGLSSYAVGDIIQADTTTI